MLDAQRSILLYIVSRLMHKNIMCPKKVLNITKLLYHSLYV